jgi:Tol biopolymer transport system component
MMRKIIRAIAASVALALAGGITPAALAQGVQPRFDPGGPQGWPFPADQFTMPGPCNQGKPPGFQLRSTIAFTSTRDNPTLSLQAGAEIYLASPDGTNVRRLTENAFGDAFANLSPDGKRIVFDSNRLTAGTVIDGVTYNNISDLFLMNPDGSDQTLLTRGSSATWSPDCKQIAFHASATYYASGGAQTGVPIKPDPGAATTDSDIFVANVEDLLGGTGQPTNITNTPGLIEDDADWSVPTADAPDGRIVFTAHPTTDNPNLSNQAEIYVMNPDGSDRLQLTGNNPDPRFDNIEERAPAWSPDGTRIAFSCRIGGDTVPNSPFQICVINADGSDEQQLTSDPAPRGQDLTASWSPDGQQIVFHKMAPGEGFQLFTMNPELGPNGKLPTAIQITSLPGISLLAHWGVLRVHG